MGKKRTITGLDIGSQTIKAVEVITNGKKFEISRCASTPRGQEDDLTETIDAFFKDNGLSRKNVVTTLNGKNLITRYIAMPETPESEIYNAVMAEADKYIPFDVEDVLLDCQKIHAKSEKTESGEIQVLLVAIKRNIVEAHLARLHDAKLQVRIIDADEFALGNAFEFANSGEALESAVALVDIGASKSSVNIIHQKESVFTREFFNGGNVLSKAISEGFDKSITEAEAIKCDPGDNKEIIDTVLAPVVDELASEINLAIDYFENQYGDSLSHVYLTGGATFYPELDLMFSQGLQRPTATWNPFENNVIMRPNNIDVEATKPLGAQYAIALGLALRGDV